MLQQTSVDGERKRVKRIFAGALHDLARTGLISLGLRGKVGYLMGVPTTVRGELLDGGPFRVATAVLRGLGRVVPGLFCVVEDVRGDPAPPIAQIRRLSDKPGCSRAEKRTRTWKRGWLIWDTGFRYCPLLPFRFREGNPKPKRATPQHEESMHPAT